MQNIVIDKPYVFVPPYKGSFWTRITAAYLLHLVKGRYGVTNIEVRHDERLRESIAAGHGILLTPNHSRDCDPLVLGALSKKVDRHFYLMASWHLFMQGRAMAWVLHRAGGFSVYREGMDRASVNAATEILEEAQRPLVLFPEGFVSHANDRVNALLEGTSVIARAAAKKRAKLTPPGKVVVHPIALRYSFGGDLAAAVGPVLEEIETRLSWQPQRSLALVERVAKVGTGLLCLKEIEYFGEPQQGSMHERLTRLIDRLLVPLEQEWTGGEREPLVIGRIKKIRSAILPDIVKGEVDEAEKQRRWRQLADVYLAQQLWNYPPDYLQSNPTPDRLLETVERYEEDLTDKIRPHAPLTCTIQVGEAIEVNPAREARGSTDPLLQKIEEQLKAMLGIGKAASAAAATLAAVPSGAS